MDVNLKDKVVLVTGGSHGLGKAICLQAAAEGARVVVNYRKTPEKANAIVQEIKETYGVEAMAGFGDVAKEKDIVALFKRIDDTFGQIDCLVNNALLNDA